MGDTVKPSKESLDLLKQAADSNKKLSQFQVPQPKVGNPSFQPYINADNAAKADPGALGAGFNSFINQAGLNIPNLPTGNHPIASGIGSFLGYPVNAAEGIAAAGALGLAPEVAVPAGLGLGGFLGSGSQNVRQQLNSGKPFNVGSALTDAAVGAGAMLVPGSQAEALLPRVLGNFGRFGTYGGLGSAASQLASTGQIDPNQAIQQALQFGGLGAAGAFAHATPKETLPEAAPVQPSTELQSSPPLLTGGTAQDIPQLTTTKPYGLLTGDTQTPTAGENGGVILNNAPTGVEVAPQQLSGGNAYETPALPGETITPPERQLTTGGELPTEPTSQQIPLAGTGTKVGQEFYNQGRTVVPTDLGGTLEQTTQGILLKGLGETTTDGQPVNPRNTIPTRTVQGSEGTVPTEPTSGVSPPTENVPKSGPQLNDQGHYDIASLTHPTDANGQEVNQTFVNRTAANRAINNLSLDKETVQPFKVGPKQWALHDQSVLPTEGSTGSVNTKPEGLIPEDNKNLTTGQPVASESSFKTSQGSSYKYKTDENGFTKTTRDKSLHLMHDSTDIGIKPESSRTIFVKPEDTRAISDMLYTHGKPKPSEMYIKDNQLMVRNYTGIEGRNLSEKIIPFSNTPEQGFHPLEFWEDGGKHLGSQISELEKPLTKTNDVSSPVSESLGGNERALINPANPGRGLTPITAEEAVKLGANSEHVNGFKSAIEKNSDLNTATGQSVDYKYEGNITGRTSDYESANLTPVGFFKNKSGSPGVVGVNSEGFPTTHYFEHPSGSKVASTPVVSEKAPIFHYNTSKAERASGVTTKQYRETVQPYSRIKDLVPPDHPAAKELKRIQGLIEKGPSAYGDLKASIKRLKAAGQLDEVLSKMQDVTGAC